MKVQPLFSLTEIDPTIVTCFNPLSLWVMLGMKGGWTKAKWEYMDKGPPSRCKMCGEVGHQTIGCHYHPSILDDKKIPNQKNQINDSGKDMDMSYIRMNKQKDNMMLEAPILEYQMKQLKPNMKPQEVTPLTF